jgi:hypothetical protein
MAPSSGEAGFCSWSWGSWRGKERSGRELEEGLQVWPGVEGKQELLPTQHRQWINSGRDHPHIEQQIPDVFRDRGLWAPVLPRPVFLYLGSCPHLIVQQ